MDMLSPGGDIASCGLATVLSLNPSLDIYSDSPQGTADTLGNVRFEPNHADRGSRNTRT